MQKNIHRSQDSITSKAASDSQREANYIHIMITLTKDPIIRGESCMMKASYCNKSGRKSYITVVANGKQAEKLLKQTKGDTMWIDGRLSGFTTDKWKSYIEVKKSYLIRRKIEDTDETD